MLVLPNFTGLVVLRIGGGGSEVLFSGGWRTEFTHGWTAAGYAHCREPVHQAYFIGRKD